MTEINDVFGIKPYGEALKITVEKSADGIGKFLSTICLPAAAEFGLLLQDNVRYWRLNNIIRMVSKSQNKFVFDKDKLELNPRIGVEIIENSSWQEDDLILEMWAGLLASSLDENGKDDSNLIFINLLKSLTGVQCRILNFICQQAKPILDRNGLIYVKENCDMNLEELFEISGCKDIGRLDREIDHLRALELLPNAGILSSGGGFSVDQEDLSRIGLQPSSLALHMYSKVNGHSKVEDCYELKK